MSDLTTRLYISRLPDYKRTELLVNGEIDESERILRSNVWLYWLDPNISKKRMTELKDGSILIFSGYSMERIQATDIPLIKSRWKGDVRKIERYIAEYEALVEKATGTGFESTKEAERLAELVRIISPTYRREE